MRCAPLSKTKEVSMSNDISALSKSTTAGLPTGISYLANEALRQIGLARMFDPSVIEGLIRSSLSPKHADLAAAIDALTKNGHSIETVVSEFVPKIAEQLGIDWVEDRRNWVDVSISASRLQDIVASSPSTSSKLNGSAGRVLVLTPAHEQHVLSAAILQKRISFLGHYAERASDVTPEDVLGRFDVATFDTVFISQSRSDDFSVTSKIAAEIKTAAPYMPVLLGGYVARQGIKMPDGIDMVTNELTEALSFSGISVDHDHIGLSQQEENTRSRS